MNQLTHQDEKILRWQIQLLYYKAQIALETGQYQRAQISYAQALMQAESIGWKRATIYIQDWLSLVAIKQENYEEAERQLNAVLPEATRYQDSGRCFV